MISRSEEFAVNRRAFLARYAGCLGSFALAHLLGEDRAKAAQGSPTLSPARPLAPSSPHHPPRAQSVICLFQHGGPSQMDLFDPKPALNQWNGKDYPGKDLEIHFDKQAGKLLESPYKFQQHSQSGMEFSELLPHTASIADELTLIRSMTTDSID